MKKEYPERRRIYDDGESIDYDDKCECGHGWEYHPIDWLFRRMKCEKCLCPKYKLDVDNPSERRLILSKKPKTEKVE